MWSVYLSSILLKVELGKTLTANGRTKCAIACNKHALAVSRNDTAAVAQHFFSADKNRGGKRGGEGDSFRTLSRDVGMKKCRITD